MVVHSEHSVRRAADCCGVGGMTERELDERDLMFLDMSAEGATIAEIAELFDVDREYVARLVREAWGDGED